MGSLLVTQVPTVCSGVKRFGWAVCVCVWKRWSEYERARERDRVRLTLRATRCECENVSGRYAVISSASPAKFLFTPLAVSIAPVCLPPSLPASLPA